MLCVGATHAFGGLLPTLAAASPLLSADGLLMVGEGYWLEEPSPQALEIFGPDYADLASTVDRVVAEGWTPVYGHVSTREELDDHEWCWTGSLADWALDQPPGPDREESLRSAAEHREEWLHGYRSSFGFVTLVLRRTS